MRKTPIAAFAALCLAGCQPATRSSHIEYVITPSDAGHTFVLSCETSSSGACHFLFAKDGTAVSRIDIETGTTIAVRDIPSGSAYCSGVQTPLLSACKPGPLPDKRATVKKSFSTTGEVID